MASQNTGNRRGSYIYAASAAEEGDVSGPYGRPAYLYGRPDENLLVDFPERSQSGNRVVNNHDMNNNSNSNNMNHNNSQGHNPNIDMQMQQMQMQQMQMQQMQMQQMQMQNGGPNMNGDGSQLQYHPQQYAGNVPYDASQYAYAAQAQQYAQYSTDQAGGGNASGNGSSGWNKPAGRRSEAARMEELADSQDLPGGPNHRPLVGGFAAAAYEAAKAHHYSMKTKSDGNSGGRPKDGPPPPSI